jgi:filamentous hemagglutinin family protein
VVFFKKPMFFTVRLFLKSFRRLTRRLSLTLVLIIGLGTVPATAQITPNGLGTQLNRNGNTFNIQGGTQAGRNLFHSFQQFGLHQGQIANFWSNPAIANILARVNGGSASYINGLIQVLGGRSNLFLMNPAGIVFGANASLNVPAAFTATTADRILFPGGSFYAYGENHFANLAGDPIGFAFDRKDPAAIVNEANLTATSVGLVAGQVINTGKVTANQITIAAMPGENLVRLSQTGQILSLEFNPQQAAAVADASGTIPITRLPELLTGGGVTTVTANPDQTVTLAGVAVPMSSGSALIGGVLDASSGVGNGGYVGVFGTNISLVNAEIHASGLTGGGEILIGGEFQGKGTQPNALNTWVNASSILRADAVQVGNGGRIIVWADGTTKFAGSISAKGGELGGDGGFAEVSGKEHLWMTGFADLSATKGKFGTLLLDPGSVIIQDGKNLFISQDRFNDDYIVTQLGKANLTITTAESASTPEETITVNGDVNITWSAPTTLTLDAGQNIVLNSGAVIENTNASTGFDAIVFQANTAGKTSGNFIGIEIKGATLKTDGGNIKLTGQGGDISFNNYGIYQNSGAQVSTTKGNITYNGTGGNGTDTNYGVYLLGENTKITSTDGAITITGTGQGTGSFNNGIVQRNGAQVSSTNGSITYNGTGGNGTDSNRGVFLVDTNTIIFSDSGAISITGTGGGNGRGKDNAGVYQLNGAQVSSSNGSITYAGTGGNGTDTNYGVYLLGENTKITSTDGAITITGTGGGNGRGKDNAGVYQLNGAQVSSSNGSITYNGTGGNGTDTNYGVYLLGENTKITSTDGAITITGTGQGTGRSNFGVVQVNGAQVSTARRNITYTGTGGNGTDKNHGVVLLGSDTNIASTAGSIIITGKGGSKGIGSENYGIYQLEGAQVSTASGNITYAGTGGSGTDRNHGVVVEATNIKSETGAITIIGSGQGTGSDNYGILQINAAQVSTNSGNITYDGTGGNGKDSNYGVHLLGENVKITSTDGAITIIGTGGGDGTGNNNLGIYQLNGAQVNTTNGSITYNGTGGNGTDSNRGVLLSGANTTISSNSQAITITGKGQGTGKDNDGIVQENGAQVNSTNGSITYNGTGGNGTDSNYGVFLIGENTKISTTGTGAISITGKGGGNGTGEGNVGIFQFNVQVSSSNGSITYDGTGGNGTGLNVGVFLSDENTKIFTTGTGAISITGKGGGNGTGIGNLGIVQLNGAQVSSTNGNITLTSTNNGITLSNATIQTTKNIIIESPGLIFQNDNGGLFANDLELKGTGDYELTSLNNDVNTLTLNNTTGLVSFKDTNALSFSGIGMLGAVDIFAQGDITQTSDLNTTGDVVLTSLDGKIDATGNNITSAAGGVFLTTSGGEVKTGDINASTTVSIDTLVSDDFGNPVFNVGDITTGNITVTPGTPNLGEDSSKISGLSVLLLNYGALSVKDVSAGNGGIGLFPLTKLEAENLTSNGGIIFASTSAVLIPDSKFNGDGRITKFDSKTFIDKLEGGSVKVGNVTSGGGSIVLISPDPNNTLQAGILDSTGTKGTLYQIPYKDEDRNTVPNEKRSAEIFIFSGKDIKVERISSQGSAPIHIATPSGFLATDTDSDGFSIRTKNGALIDLQYALKGNFNLATTSSLGTKGAITNGRTTLNPIRTFECFPENCKVSENISIRPTDPSFAEALRSSDGKREDRQPPRPDLEFSRLPSLELQLIDTSQLLELSEVLKNQLNVATEEGIFSLDVAFGAEFANYLGVKAANTLRSAADVQTLLQNIYKQTGRKTAIVYWVLDQINLSIVMLTPGIPQGVAQNQGIVVASVDLATGLVQQPKTAPLIYRGVPSARRDEVFRVISRFRNQLSDRRWVGGKEYLKDAQTLYRWLIEPIAPELQAQGIDTLLVVPDRGIRLLPLAALHDGKQFLIEKYNLAMTPSVNLISTRYRSLQGAEVLAMGASTFANENPLPSVPTELKTITSVWPGRYFLNQDFTPERLIQERKSGQFRMVHLATHATFKPGDLRDSYIVFGNNQNLPVTQLPQLSLQGVELLTLGACRTLIGDITDPTVEFGFAGLAVKTGVQTAVASLWNVDDTSTFALMAEFYTNLQSTPIKAEALRQAQLALLRGQTKVEGPQLRLVTRSGQSIPLPSELAQVKGLDFAHPYFWSGFSMIGSPW